MQTAGCVQPFPWQTSECVLLCIPSKLILELAIFVYFVTLLIAYLAKHQISLKKECQI